MSSPFTPPSTPNPAPASTPMPNPYAPPYQHATTTPPATGPMWQPQHFGYAPAKQRNGLAITAIVLSGLALVGVILTGLIGFGVAASSSLGPSWVLQGSADPIGTAVTGQALERALTTLVEDDGGSVDTITCPDSSTVGQGLVTVCHGSVDGSEWTGMVVFEDSKGTFIVDQL